MTWPYEYTPYIWAHWASAVYLSVLAIYAIRHRTAPGALPLTVLVVVAILWVLANGLVLASPNDQTRIFWWNFQFVLLLPLSSAELCLGLEYAGLGKWVNRRTVFLLAIVPVALVPLIFTNEIHHFVWRQIWFDGHMRFDRGPANWGAVAYIYFLSVLYLMVLTWLFGRSPRHRSIIVGLFIAFLSMRVASFINIMDRNPVAPMNPMVIVLSFGMLAYAMVIFRFHMFDVVSVARDTAIERMAYGMMVLDIENRIADVNEAAQKLLGVIKSKVIGSHIADVLHAYPDLLCLVGESGKTQCEVSFGDTNTRWYQASISPLIDRRGFQLGHLIWFHDVTDQKQARAQILDQHQTLAMLKERELLARELHDGIGQMLAAAHLQVKSVSELLTRGDTGLAQSSLLRLAEVTQEAKESLRDYLRGVKTRSSLEEDLLTSLRQYLKDYSHNHGIHTELVAPQIMEVKRFNSTVEAQLHLIIHEALTNVRRHAGASSARVIFEMGDSEIQVRIEDDGRGFDPEAIGGNEGFGLRAMRGRADGMGGRLEVNSKPGTGTQVVVRLPWRKESI